MKKILSLLFLTTTLAAQAGIFEEYPPVSNDSLNMVFIYSPGPNNGLHIAAYQPDSTWRHVGQLLSSDYGPWGSGKKMHHPSVSNIFDKQGKRRWYAVWQVDETSPCFAAAYSENLINWRPQDYPRMSTRGCLKPEVNTYHENYIEVAFVTPEGQGRSTLADLDFRHFTLDRATFYCDLDSIRESIIVDGKQQIGDAFLLTRAECDALMQHFQDLGEDYRRSSERMFQDPENLKLTQPVTATLKVNTAEEKAISDQLIGIFFEDISYAADGGLYAEMVQNRDFEYKWREGRAEGWGPTYAWHSPAKLKDENTDGLSIWNSHYLVLGTDSVWNEGWDGMVVKAKAKYDFSCYVRALEGQKPVQLTVALMEGSKTLAKTVVKTKDATQWTRLTATLTSKADAKQARLVLLQPKNSKNVGLDMVSLFPQDTYKGHGLRRDLAEAIAALHPRFVRFPGGCMSHGQGIRNIYHWDMTIGPWQDRRPDFNIWGYHQTRGLGFYEFFQWCEDMGAEPLPVLAAGVPCQNSQPDADGMAGQQDGIPMPMMQAYCEELGHLIEWANFDPATNKWAKKRAEAGHPEPFHLKYIGIGNEDLISTVFEERYEMIAKYLHQHYPDIKICGTAGPFHYPSSDYTEGWHFGKANQDNTYMLDEHYYESSGWFLNHQDYYDQYDRKGPKVYLGEWSAKGDKNISNVEAALAEAIYLCNLERNGDIVEMSSYAPLLCHKKHGNWNPNLIYFDNEGLTLTPSYETQRLFGTYAGDRYVASSLKVTGNKLSTEMEQRVERRIEASVVYSSKDGKRYLKLVNALPVETTFTVEGITLPATVEAEGFEGQPRDREARCEKRQMQTKGGALTLPPYSIRVVAL